LTLSDTPATQVHWAGNLQGPPMTHDSLRTARFVLVLSSLSPLFILWAIRGSEAVDDAWWISFCAAAVIIPNLFLWAQITTARRRDNTKTIQVASAKDQNEQLLVYLFAMLIPLFGVELNTPRGLVALLFAVLFVAFVFWHMKLHYMNLFLALAGYRIFTITTGDGARNAGDSQEAHSYVVITKRHSIEVGGSLTGLRLGGNVLVDEGKDDPQRVRPRGNSVN
jgi:hypothetical protein